jgi:hypothetical protein
MELLRAHLWYLPQDAAEKLESNAQELHISFEQDLRVHWPCLPKCQPESNSVNEEDVS